MRISDWSSDVCSSDLVVRSRCSPHFVTHTIIIGRGNAVGWQAYEGSKWRTTACPKRVRQLSSAYRNNATACRPDRKSVGEGKGVSVRVDLGGRGIIKKKKTLITQLDSHNY